jgi:hypothetical protein
MDSVSSKPRQLEDVPAPVVREQIALWLWLFLVLCVTWLIAVPFADLKAGRVNRGLLGLAPLGPFAIAVDAALNGVVVAERVRTIIATPLINMILLTAYPLRPRRWTRAASILGVTMWLACSVLYLVILGESG